MISVCIATYNGEKYIKEQLDSIIPQLLPDDEIVISDDGSSDNTINIIKSLNSPLIHIYCNTGEHGYTPNFENALRYAKGDYIFLSDQDDIWSENKVSVCMDYFRKYDFIISDADIIDEFGCKKADSFFEIRHTKLGFIRNIIKFGFLGCCMAFKKDVLCKALPFPDNHKFCTHDQWLSLMGMFFFKSIVIEDKLIHYRRHNKNSSSGGMKSTTSLMFKLKYRIYLVKWIVYCYFR